MLVYVAAGIIILVACVLIWRNFIDLKNHNEGTDEMKELTSIIRSGAKTFLKREYRIIIPTILIVGLLYSLFREVWSGLTFIFGAALSTAAFEIGMRGWYLCKRKDHERSTCNWSYEPYYANCFAWRLTQWLYGTCIWTSRLFNCLATFWWRIWQCQEVHWKWYIKRPW